MPNRIIELLDSVNTPEIGPLLDPSDYSALCDAWEWRLSRFPDRKDKAPGTLLDIFMTPAITREFVNKYIKAGGQDFSDEWVETVKDSLQGARTIYTTGAWSSGVVARLTTDAIKKYAQRDSVFLHPADLSQTDIKED